MKLTTWTAQGIGASIQIEGTDEAGEYQIVDDVVEIKNDVRLFPAVRKLAIIAGEQACGVLAGRFRGSPAAIIGAAYTRPAKRSRCREPCVSFIGNTTSAAHIVRALLDASLGEVRPDHCAGCAANWDAMSRARTALGLPGSC